VLALHFAGLRHLGSQPVPPLHTADELRGFVEATYIHGIDEYKALEYRSVPDAVGILRDIRQRPGLKDYWQNAIIMHGVLGHTEVHAELVKFLEEDVTSVGAKPLTITLSPSLYRAKLSVLRALGLLANQTSDERTKNDIEQYLERGTRPSSWTERGIVWRGPYEKDKKENRVRNTQLSEKAILALGFCKTDRVQEFLNSLKAGLEDATVDQSGRAHVSTASWKQEVLVQRDVSSLLEVTREAIQTNFILRSESMETYLKHHQ